MDSLEKELRQWGEWVRKQNAPKSGYAKITVIGRLMEYGVSLGILRYEQYTPESSYNVHGYVDSLINLLQPKYRRVIHIWYVSRGTGKEKARLLGISRKQMYIQLLKARCELLDIGDTF